MNTKTFAIVLAAVGLTVATAALAHGPQSDRSGFANALHPNALHPNALQPNSLTSNALDSGSVDLGGSSTGAAASVGLGLGGANAARITDIELPR